jgi:hypothetical protein
MAGIGDMVRVTWREGRARSSWDQAGDDDAIFTGIEEKMA